MHTRVRCLLVSAASLLIQPLQAQSLTPPSTVDACKACHGPQGISRNPTFPNLAGQKAGYIEAQLKAFKAKERKNDYMNAIAGAVQSYSAMESRAGWGSTVPQLLRNGDWDYALFSADGKRRDQLNQAPCLACHKPQEANSYVFTLDALRKAAS